MGEKGRRPPPHPKGKSGMQGRETATHISYSLGQDLDLSPRVIVGAGHFIALLLPSGAAASVS